MDAVKIDSINWAFPYQQKTSLAVKPGLPGNMALPYLKVYHDPEVADLAESLFMGFHQNIEI